MVLQQQQSQRPVSSITLVPSKVATLKLRKACQGLSLALSGIEMLCMLPHESSAYYQLDKKQSKYGAEAAPRSFVACCV